MAPVVVPMPRNDPKGVSSGMRFRSRAALASADVYLGDKTDLEYTEKRCATSIVLDGAFWGDDKGSSLRLHGFDTECKQPIATADGRICYHQVKDEDDYAPGVTAMRKAEKAGFLVLVIRGPGGCVPYSPSTCYRYDGIYQILQHSVERSKNGYRKIYFELKRIDGTYIIPKNDMPYTPEWKAPSTEELERRARSPVRKSNAPNTGPHASPNRSRSRSPEKGAISRMKEKFAKGRDLHFPRPESPGARPTGRASCLQPAFEYTFSERKPKSSGSRASSSGSSSATGSGVASPMLLSTPNRDMYNRDRSASPVKRSAPGTPTSLPPRRPSPDPSPMIMGSPLRSVSMPEPQTPGRGRPNERRRIGLMDWDGNLASPPLWNPGATKPKSSSRKHHTYAGLSQT